MKKLFKYSQFLTLGVFLLSSPVVFSASTQCYSPAELNDFKTLYIKLQNELNYEGKDAYLDKNYQVRLKPHGKDQAYPGREFESALFGEYQNSLKKVGKLYQSAKFENDENFKSNEVLINFIKAIDNKSTETQDFINKTKIKDVLNALEEASKKRFSKSSDKKFMITAGDKYLLEKLLIHAQDRVCSVNKYEATNKDTALFKADYLKQIKNAPLNILVNTIKNAPIEKDSKIDLRPSSDLVATLVDPDVAIQSAVADNLNQLSAWVKKVKAQGPECFAAIKRKEFANNIQGNIQGCNFGQFIETLGQNNVNNLESVLHFINANEKLLNNPAAKAETGMNELKLEGFISKSFDNLGTAVRCTVLDPANSGDKKIFIRNLPFNEKTNKFDTSGIICKSNSRILGADACTKQFDLSSDGLGRGIEIKPKTGTSSNLTLSVKDSDNCSDIPLLPTTTSSLASTPEQCSALLKDGSAFVWDTKNSKCNEVEISKVSSIEQCVALKKQGSVFNWNDDKKSCGEFSALLVDATLKQTAQQCMTQKKNGYSFKWDSAKKSCDETPTIAGTKLESKISCDAKTAAMLPFKWNAQENSCDSTLASTKNSALIPDLAKVTSLEQCVALKKSGSVFNWNSDKKSCEEHSALLASAGLLQASQQCLAQKKNGYDFKWDSANKSCREIPTISGTKLESKIACDAKTSAGLPFKWNNSEFVCEKAGSNKEVTNETSKEEARAPALATKTADVSEKIAKMACEAKSSPGNTVKWNSANKSCEGSMSATSNDGSKSQVVKPIVLVKETTPVSSNPTAPVVGSSGPVTPPTTDVIKKDTTSSTTPPQTSGEYKDVTLSNLIINNAKRTCENQKEEGFAFEWNKETSECIKSDVAKAKNDCEIKNTPEIEKIFKYNWDEINLKCKKIDLKAQENCEKETPKEGFTKFWDSVKEICNDKANDPAAAADNKSPDADANQVDKEKQCVDKNTKWMNEENDGVFAVRYEWRDNDCQDKHKEADGGKKSSQEEAGPQEAEPIAPKRAPARFTPVNIPSRQIYLMPGMP